MRKWLAIPIYEPFWPFGRGTNLLRGLTVLTRVIDHLQVDDPPSTRPIFEASFATLAVEVGCREHFFCLS